MTCRARQRAGREQLAGREKNWAWSSRAWTRFRVSR